MLSNGVSEVRSSESPFYDGVKCVDVERNAALEEDGGDEEDAEVDLQ